MRPRGTTPVTGVWRSQCWKVHVYGWNFELARFGSPAG